MHELAWQVGQAVVHLSAALEFLQLHAVLREPLAVGVCLGQLLLDLAVVVDASLLGVDEQYLAGLQSALGHHVAGLKVHHAHLAGHHHHTLLGDGVAAGSQTVTVEHAAGIASVAEQQGGGSVPGLHQDGVVFVEGLEVLGYGVLVVEALGHQDGHGLRQRESAHHEELEHVVEASRVAHALLHDGAKVLDITQRLAAEHTLSCLHPAAVATNGVDLTVVGQQSEGLCQFPFGEGIG